MPWLELLLALGFVAALGWAFWRFAIPFFENLGNHAYSCQKEPPSTPAPATPVPTPEPTHDPYPDHPLYSADLKSMQTEIVVPEYQYATDLTVVNGTVYAPVGNYTPDGTAAFVRLLQYDTNTKTQRLLPLPLNYNAHVPCPAATVQEHPLPRGQRQMDRLSRCGGERRRAHRGVQPADEPDKDAENGLYRTAEARAV